MNSKKSLIRILITLILSFIMIVSCAISLSSCGKDEISLPKEISQEDWNSCRQYVNLSTGIKMSYVEMGDPNGEVVILQHGMTDNSRSWSLTAPYFANAGYHVYMPDLRGQGKSQEADGYYTTVTYATDLKAFFDAKNIDKAIVIGHSLGSYTIQNFWMMFPEKCTKVVLVSSLPLNGYQNTRLTSIVNMLDNLKDDEELSDTFMDFWYSSTCQEQKYNNGVFDTFLENMKKEAQSLSKKSWLNIVKGLIASNINDLYPYFNKTIPALVLHGNDDDMARGEYQQELLDDLGISNANYKNYIGVGHNIHFEIPEQFATDVLYWIKNGVLPSQEK